MGDTDSDDISGLQNGKAKLSVILVCIGSTTLVLTIYHCIAMGWCRRRRHHRDSHRHGAERPQSQEHEHQREMLEQASLENSTAQLIPAHKYQKGMGLVADDGMCPVCLSQFEEGEELRTLPECLHSYHVPCIDMWLYSHSSCPMCRSDAMPTPTPSPSPQIFPVHRPDSSSSVQDSSPLHLDSGMLHSIVQGRTM